MTSDQQQRFLGQLALGLSAETALEGLGLTGADLERQKSADRAFAVACGLVSEVSAEFARRILDESGPE